MKNDRSSVRPRLLAGALVLAAASAALLIPTSSTALPMCGYVIYWYSDPAKTQIVGLRSAMPEACGCAQYESGQRTSYSTLTPVGPPCVVDY